MGDNDDMPVTLHQLQQPLQTAQAEAERKERQAQKAKQKSRRAEKKAAQAEETRLVANERAEAAEEALQLADERADAAEEALQYLEVKPDCLFADLPWGCTDLQHDVPWSKEYLQQVMVAAAQAIAPDGAFVIRYDGSQPY